MISTVACYCTAPPPSAREPPPQSSCQLWFNLFPLEGGLDFFKGVERKEGELGHTQLCSVLTLGSTLRSLMELLGAICGIWNRTGVSCVQNKRPSLCTSSLDSLPFLCVGGMTGGHPHLDEVLKHSSTHTLSCTHTL